MRTNEDIVDKMTHEEIYQIRTATGQQRKELWDIVLDKYKISGGNYDNSKSN